MTTNDWRTTFGIEGVDYQPRLFRSAQEACLEPYGSAMAQGFLAGASGYLTYQGKPIAVFLDSDDSHESVEKGLWTKLWNQGLASVLIFHCPDKVEVYSLYDPTGDGGQDELKYIQLFDAVELGLERYNAQCKELVRKVEDGSYYSDYSAFFKTEERVDRRLLRNLTNTCRALVDQGLELDQTQALLLQIVFIAYLEDRGIINPPYFLQITDNQYDKLEDVLGARDVAALSRLFCDLREKFNGDIFASPCSFQTQTPALLSPNHLGVLWDFRSGRIDSASRQLSLLRLYDFKFIPVELLSAIYDRFQDFGQDVNQERRASGSYFTPAFLAQTCLDLAWRHLSEDAVESDDFKVLDPACGSAVFLVCVFQRLVGLAVSKGRPPEWGELRDILGRVHGIDISDRALRVGIISLYIALLEHVDPPALAPLLEEGKILPPLLRKTMRAVDFFSDAVDPEVEQYDLIIGNPPWVSRKKVEAASALAWCKANGFKDDMPGKCLVWGFIWKSGKMLTERGTAALLLEAKQVLFNLQAEKTRRRLFAKYKVPLVVNFADARHQLFEGADAPGALCVIQRRPDGADKGLEDTEYWSPKANPVFSAAQRIVLSPEDRVCIRQWRLSADSSLLAQRQWGRSRDVTLLQELKRFSKLSERLLPYKDWKRSSPDDMWCIGEGFNAKPAKKPLEALRDIPFVDANLKMFKWVLPSKTISWHGEQNYNIYRSNLMTALLVKKSVSPPMVLIKQGVSKSTGIMNATYTEQRVSFQHSIQAIVSTRDQSDADVFKILTVILNSKFAAWYFLNSSAVRGVERDKVLQGEILLLPFPLPEESDAPEAGEKIIDLMNWYAGVRQAEDRDQQNVLRNEIGQPAKLADKFDELVYQYYGLTDHERLLVEDTVKYIIPSMQPGRKNRPILWELPDRNLYQEYAEYLQEGLFANYAPGTSLGVTVYGGRQSLALAVITRDAGNDCGVESSDVALTEQLERLNEAWPGEFAKGVHHLVNLIFAVEDKIYLVKPNRVRHWMGSTGLCDVDRIVADLHAAKAGAPV